MLRSGIHKGRSKSSKLSDSLGILPCLLISPVSSLHDRGGTSGNVDCVHMDFSRGRCSLFFQYTKDLVIKLLCVYLIKMCLFAFGG